MIGLNSPVVQEGVWYSTDAVEQGCFQGRAEVQNRAVIGPMALARTLSEIDSLCTTFLPNEDTPTPHAHETANRLLAEAQALEPIFLGATIIEGSEGDLLIHWDTSIKGVVLICPGSAERTPQIYSEILEGNKASESTIEVATPLELSRAITWVLQTR